MVKAVNLKELKRETRRVNSIQFVLHVSLGLTSKADDCVASAARVLGTAHGGNDLAKSIIETAFKMDEQRVRLPFEHEIMRLSPCAACI